jgi:hypothetical protein
MTKNGDPIREKMAEKKIRPVYVYAVPAAVADGVTEIGMVQLTAHEEMMCARRSNADPFRLVYEQAKQSLVEVNGERVKPEDGSVDAAFERMSPPVRNMVLQAFSKLHSPAEDALQGFLASQTVRVA